MAEAIRKTFSALMALSTILPGIALLSEQQGIACGGTECSYGSGCYSQNACRGGQRCKMNGNDPFWADDESCPC